MEVHYSDRGSGVGKRAAFAIVPSSSIGTGACNDQVVFQFALTL